MEHKLEYTELHNGYKALFEKQAQRVLEASGYEYAAVLGDFGKYLKGECLFLYLLLALTKCSIVVNSSA